MAKISINSQIDEVKRELARRKTESPALVSGGKIRQSAADYHDGCLRAALATLEYVRDHRDAFLQACKIEETAP